MIRAIGAGVGRTGTRSLQKALEHLLKGKCYHMFEVGKKPDDITFWKNVAQGKKPNWSSFFSQWTAAVDWPAAAFWPEISASFPNALIILSKRDPEEWWSSASNTIFKVLRQAETSAWKEMVFEVLRSRFTANITDKDIHTLPRSTNHTLVHRCNSCIDIPAPWAPTRCSKTKSSARCTDNPRRCQQRNLTANPFLMFIDGPQIFH